MQLDEYLFRNKLHCTEFAPLCNCSAGYLVNIKNKKFRPSKKQARWIVEATNGQVTYEELMEGFPLKEKNKKV